MDLSGECAEGVTCTVYTIGQSYEGRDMTVFKVRSFQFHIQALQHTLLVIVGHAGTTTVVDLGFGKVVVQVSFGQIYL